MRKGDIKRKSRRTETMDIQYIPIVVGITGHRNLREEDIPELKRLVSEELTALQNKYPNSDILMLDSLAAGADILCAQVAAELNIPVVCPLPMALEEYEKDFTPEELRAFKECLGRAENEFVVPAVEEVREERDFGYRQAGIYIAAHCHVLIALWDGEPPVENGCGTANVVDFVLNENYQTGELLNAQNEGAVIHIDTPRQGSESPLSGKVTLLENVEGSLEELLRQTDVFNKDASLEKKRDGYPLLPEQFMNQPGRVKIQKIYDIADQMAVHWQTRYLRIMKLIAIFSVILVLLYLLYDEAGLTVCIIGFGIVTAMYAISTAIINKMNQHGKYLQYRRLAETVRVQMYLHSLGDSRKISSAFTWTQKHEATWVKKAVDALMIGLEGEAPIPMDVVKRTWIDGQCEYHKHSGNRDARACRFGDNVTKGMMICILVLWAIVLTLEYGFATIMSTELASLQVRTWLGIVWGCASAVALFISSYYGKLSLQRKSQDHEKMANLFALAGKQYDRYPSRRGELFYKLGREELIENENWVSYCQENGPDFSI